MLNLHFPGDREGENVREEAPSGTKIALMLHITCTTLKLRVEVLSIQGTYSITWMSMRKTTNLLVLFAPPVLLQTMLPDQEEETLEPWR